jgi:hypothetical protein
MNQVASAETNRAATATRWSPGGQKARLVSTDMTIQTKED